MSNWLAAVVQCDQPSILVTVARVEGSAPREPGAKLLVTADGQYDTIGGGHLEWCAIDTARQMLALDQDQLPSQRHYQRFALGPTLGQCCGGVVYLAFERITAASRDVYADLSQRWQRGQSSWRMLSLDAAMPPSLSVEPAGHAQACHVLDEAGKRWLIDPCLPYSARLLLFGAGHVGAALVRLLATLPCHVTWIDVRDHMFPDDVPANVTCEATDTPQALIDAAPAGASFLVMTHSHSLDQDLAECILRRRDVGWFGLIGSRTKRIQFERRLRARGISEERLAAMVCPIGIAGIEGKEPPVIAVAVAAQLLQRWEAQQSGTAVQHTEERFG